jgi:regulator of sirC expression with transglutaminase-like and TPR domain
VVTPRSVSAPSPRTLRAALEAGEPIDELALRISRDLRAAAPIDKTRALFDEAAASLLAARADQASPTRQALLLRELVFYDHAFRGNEEDYYDPRNSDLTEVVGRRVGIPITLATVMIAIGRRAGIPIEGVGFPGHFLVRVGSDDAHVLVDPFVDGREVEATHLDQLSTRFLGGPGRVLREHLLPVDARSMLVRLLVNLKHAVERRSQHAAALVACDRLVDLTGAVEFRRDRGMHALAMGASQAAIADLEAYLSESAGPPDQTEVERAIARARATVENVRPS